METLAKDYQQAYPDLFKLGDDVLFRHTTELRNNESYFGFARALFDENNIKVNLADNEMLLKVTKFQIFNPNCKIERKSLFSFTTNVISGTLKLKLNQHRRNSKNPSCLSKLWKVLRLDWACRQINCQWNRLNMSGTCVDMTRRTTTTNLVPGVS